MRYSRDANDIGTRLGPKLVQLISQTVAATKLKLLDTEHRARVHSMQTVIDRAGHEVADLYRPLVKQVMSDREMPAEVRQFLERAISGTHQWHSIAGMSVLGSGPQSALSTIINNFLAPGVRFAVEKDPQLAPSPETLSMLVAKDLWDHSNARSWNAGSGYDPLFTDALVDASRAYPDLDTLLQLIRRGLASRGEAVLALTRNGVPAAYHNALLSLARQPLSPADLADMVVRGIKTEGEAARGAAEYGVSADDFSALVLDTGEPIALMQLLEAKRRGFIDTSRLVRGIRQSRIRDEWVDVAEKLAYSPMSTADAINAAVQNHIPLARAEQIAQQNGLEPGNAQLLYDTAGEPLSRTECEQLYDRGLMTQAEVEQALRESRLKNKYINQAFQLHAKIVPLFTLQHALRYGGMSAEYAVQQAMKQGYAKADATAIVQAASGERLQTYRDKVISAVETLYVDSLMSDTDAKSVIKSVGLSAAETEVVIQGAELRRTAHALQTAVSAVRGRYVAHRIDRHAASGLLDRSGIPATQRDYLLRVWDIERAASVRSLTEAQVVKAVTKKLITAQDGASRLMNMGYSEVDAALLLAGA